MGETVETVIFWSWRTLLDELRDCALLRVKSDLERLGGLPFGDTLDFVIAPHLPIGIPVYYKGPWIAKEKSTTHNYATTKVMLCNMYMNVQRAAHILQNGYLKKPNNGYLKITATSKH